MKNVYIPPSEELVNYENTPEYTYAVKKLVQEAATLPENIKNRKIWMINSTEHGGGVAEMLPKMVCLLRELGLDTEWLVMESDDIDFFKITKKIHNMVHSHPEEEITPDEIAVYEHTARENARLLMKMVNPGDIVIIHDPQPLGIPLFMDKSDIFFIWRCHIGTEVINEFTKHVWDVLKKYSPPYRHAVFSAPEYIPDFFAGRSSVIYPAIDPVSHKNRPLLAHKLTGILCNSRLATEHHPVLTPRFEHPALRLQKDGYFLPADLPEDTGLIYRPIVSQISRWDKLKGFIPVLKAFIEIKSNPDKYSSGKDRRHQKRLEIVRLVLAGPSPDSVADDPEAEMVLEEIIEIYKNLPENIQNDIAIIRLPMNSRKENMLMVNAIQRCSTLILQNSFQEGFGLTVTEAMWKGITVIGSPATGIRQQIRSGIDGVLLKNPEDTTELADNINELLADSLRRIRLGENARRRVYDDFLVFSQLSKWINLLGTKILPP